MRALALILVWCGAGIVGLLTGRVAPARGPAAWADWFFAAMLGPFSFLISLLASEMARDTEEGGAEGPDDPTKRDR